MILKLQVHLKVHMHEIFIVCFKLFFCIFQSLIDTNAVQPTFLKIFFKFAQIFKIFNHATFFPKAQSMAERCCRERGVKFSVVFVTVRFQIVLSVFGEEAESNFRFSAKARS
jgi:hypothetical protein